LANINISNELSYLVIRAIADFKFSKVSLDYDFDETINSETSIAYGYYFIEDGVKQPEFNVILARMKQY
jgi:hypothetical protein